MGQVRRTEAEAPSSLDESCRAPPRTAFEGAAAACQIFSGAVAWCPSSDTVCNDGGMRAADLDRLLRLLEACLFRGDVSVVKLFGCSWRSFGFVFVVIWTLHASGVLRACG